MVFVKMSLENIQGKLSRSEMKNLMAGSGESIGCDACYSDSECSSTTECRTSSSCTPGKKVCAKRHYA